MEAVQEKIAVPELRFKGFIDISWERKKLGEISTFLDGRRKPIKSGDRAKMKGVYPYYGASGIIDYVNNFIFDEELILLGEDGENIVSRNSPLAFRVSGKCWINNHAHVIIPNKGYDIDFLAHVLERVNYLIYNTGTAQPKLNQEVCRGIPLNLPALPEQEKIAGFLSAVDKKIAALQQKKEALTQYKKGVMQKLFAQEIRFKQANGQAYPNWEEKKLGEVLDYLQPTKYIVSDTEYDDSYSTPVLTAGKSFILGYTNEVDNIFLEQLPVIIFDDFTTASQFVDFPFKVKSSAMKILIAKPNENIKYIYEIMQMIKFEVGGHGRHWISKFSTLKISFPCIEEQEKIASFLSAIDKRIATCQSQIEQTTTWKKGLLQKMFV